MNTDRRVKPENINKLIERTAEAPPDDATRQAVLDAAGQHPDFDAVEVRNLLVEAGRDVELRHVLGAMRGL